MCKIFQGTIWKKSLAALLAIVLVLGVIPGRIGQVEAAYTQVTLKEGLGGLHAQDSATRYLFYMDVENFDVNTLNVGAIWGDCTVYIDGKAVTSSKVVNDVNYHVLENQLLLTVDYSVIGTGITTADQIGRHTIVIPAGTVIGNTIQVKEDIGFVVEGYSVARANISEDEAITVIPTNPHEPASTGFRFTTGEQKDSLPHNVSWTARYSFATGGVYLKRGGSTTLTTAFLIKILEDTYFIAFDNTGITFQTGDIVTIDGSVENDGYYVNYKKTSFKYDGSSWTIYEDGIFTVTHTDGGAWQGTRWLTYLATEETVPAEGTYIQSGLSIEVSCGDTKVAYDLNPYDLIVVEGKWALLLSPSDYPMVPTETESYGEYYVVTLKAGIGQDNAGNEWIIQKDVPILFSNGKAQGVIVGGNEQLLTTSQTNKGDTSGIYFDIPVDDGFAFAEDWNVRPIITGAKIQLDGSALTASAWSLVKIGECSYYFSLHPDETTGVPSTLDVNSKLTLDFYASETADSGTVIYFPETTFILIENGWVKQTLLGDVNGDMALGCADIVRLQRYFTSQQTWISEEGADANESGRVDTKDIDTIIEYLFEGAEFLVGGANSHAVTGVPYYADDTEIQTGAYFGPREAGGLDYTYVPNANASYGTISSVLNNINYLNAIEFKRYADAGLNTLFHEADALYASATAGLGAGTHSKAFQNYMALAYAQGLDVYVTSQGLNSYLKGETTGKAAVGIDFNEDGSLYDGSGNPQESTVNEVRAGWDYNGNGTLESNASMTEIFYYNDNITNGDGKTILEADIEELLDFIQEKGYDNFKGFVMADELYAASIDNYRRAVTLIRKEAKERGMTIGVFHSQHPSSATGTKDADKNYYIPENGYEDYVSSFGSAAGIFTYDRYPLLLKKSRSSLGTTYSTSKELDTDWLTNLETVATLAKAGGFTTGITVQSMGYEFGRNISKGKSVNFWRNPETDADMQFQIYTALAYGMKSINYYTYWEVPRQSTAWYTGSMVEYAGDVAKETDIYWLVQRANKEMKKFDHVFLDYDWLETLESTEAKDSSGCILNWSQTKDTLVGCMYDTKKQLNGFWLVNASNPANNESKSVSVTFANATRALVFVDGEQSLITLDNGKYQTTLLAGEGQFVIPIK